jgi:hypothetical protein
MLWIQKTAYNVGYCGIESIFSENKIYIYEKYFTNIQQIYMDLEELARTIHRRARGCRMGLGQDGAFLARGRFQSIGENRPIITWYGRSFL